MNAHPENTHCYEMYVSNKISLNSEDLVFLSFVTHGLTYRYVRYVTSLSQDSQANFILMFNACVNIQSVMNGMGTRFLQAVYGVES